MIPNFSSFDVIVIVLLISSALIGLVRGFTREFLGIVSWIGAIFITLYSIPLLRPYLTEYIKDPFVVDLVVGLVVFIITLTALGMVSRSFSIKVRGSTLGGLDRSLGLIFGFARGGVILSIIYLCVTFVWSPDKLPIPVKNARATYFIAKGANWLSRLVPEDAIKNLGIELKGHSSAEFVMDTTDEIVRHLAQPQPYNDSQNAVNEGYQQSELNDMSRLFSSNE